MRLNILLADPSSLFRAGIKLILKESELTSEIHEAHDRKQVLNIILTLPIHILFIDIKLSTISSLELVSIILKQRPTTRIIILTNYNNESLVGNYINTGISGYMLKSDRDIANAIIAVMNGRFYYSSSLESAINRSTCANTKPITLTSKQKQILTLLAEGKTSREISHHLLLSQQTVETYRKEILIKFKVKNCVELIHYAHETGML